MTTQKDERGQAARLLIELRNRAIKSLVADALILSLVVASANAIIAAFFLPSATALLAATTVFFCVACSLTALILSRAPGPFACARRVEARFPNDAGVITTTLDERVGDSELAAEARRRARALLTTCAALSDDERYCVFYAAAYDSDALRLRATRRRRLRVVASALAAMAVVALTVKTYDASERPATSMERDVAETSRDASGQDNEESESAATTPEAPASDVEVAAQTREGVETLVADLERARALARSLSDALAGSDRDDFALAVELARELDSSVLGATGLVARASDVAEFAAGTLRRSGSDGMAILPFLTTRRARELIAFFREERENRDAVVLALSGSLRGASVAERDENRKRAKALVDALAARLTDESAMFSVLATGWRFRAEQTTAEEIGETLRHEAVRLLTLRVGFEPDDRAADASRDFFELLAKRRAAWTTALAEYEELVGKLTSPERVGILAYAGRVVQDAGTTEQLLNTDGRSVERYVEGAVRTLDAVRSEARAEHWGRAATLLSGAPRYDASDVEGTEATSLALRLTFGELPESAGAPCDAYVDVNARTALSAPGIADERMRSAEEASTLRALAREASLGETSAQEGRASTRSRDELAERDGTDGSVSDVGARFDPNFAGGGAIGENGGANSGYSGAEFAAELPQDERKRVERAQKWSPSEESQRRAEAFRRRLWEAFQEER
ncbi:MAG: hypothetical protein IJL92_06565 [Thermoguttaceae bacterium]|nr:hypothetical protein [Thermoguttaceae bacterium]